MTTITVDDIRCDVADAAEVKPDAPAENALPLALRPFVLAEGEFIVPDDFNDPLPEDILRDFEGRGWEW